MTMAPDRRIIGTNSLAWVEPAEQNTRSSPLKAPDSTRRMGLASPRKLTVLPTERSEAKQRSSRTGNLRSSSTRSVVSPAAPVAPTTATANPARHQYCASTAFTIRSPISRVPMPRVPGAAISRVRAPLSRTAHDRRFDPIGVLGPVERVPQEHRPRQDRRDRVRHPLAGDVGGRAVHGLVEADLAAQGRRGQHPHGPGEDRGLIRQNITEGILGNNRVELGRPLDERHRAVVDQHMLERHVGVVPGQAGHDVPPELGDDQHVGLVDRRQPPAPLAGHLEAHAGHPLDLPRRVDHGVDAAGLAVGQHLDAARLTEVETARQLPDHHDVGARHHRRFERRGVDQHGEAARRSEIRVEVELLAQGQEPPLGLLLLGQMVPLGPTHGAEEDGLRLAGTVASVSGGNGAPRLSMAPPPTSASARTPGRSRSPWPRSGEPGPPRERPPARCRRRAAPRCGNVVT